MITLIVIAIVTGIVVILVVKKCTGNLILSSFDTLVGVAAFEVFPTHVTSNFRTIPDSVLL